MDIRQYPFAEHLDRVIDGGVDAVLAWDWGIAGILPRVRWGQLRQLRRAREALETSPVPDLKLYDQVFWKLLRLQNIYAEYGATVGFMELAVRGGIATILAWDWDKVAILPYLNWDQFWLIRLARTSLEQNHGSDLGLYDELYWKLLRLEDLAKGYSAWVLCSGPHYLAGQLVPCVVDTFRHPHEYPEWTFDAHRAWLQAREAPETNGDDDRHAMIRGQLLQGLVWLADVHLVRDFLLGRLTPPTPTTAASLAPAA